MTDTQQQPIIIRNQPPPSNGMGIAGFVLSLAAWFGGWIPVAGWIIWFLGLLFSFIGLFKKPRGLAVAGLIISLIGFIILLVVFGALAALFVASGTS